MKRLIACAGLAVLGFTGCQAVPTPFAPSAPDVITFEAPQAPGSDTNVPELPTGGKTFEAPQAPCGCGEAP